MLSLYSSGRTNGIVLDCGEGVTHSVPIYEGYSLPHGICKIPLAGHNLSQYMLSLLHDLGTGYYYHINLRYSETVANDIKEKLCYVGLDYEKEL